MNIPSMEDKIRKFENKQVIASLLGLFILLGTSLIANTLHLRSVAEQSTKFVSRLAQFGENREITLILEEARQKNFESIKYISDEPDKSFFTPPQLRWETKKSVWDYFATESVTFPIVDPLSSVQMDKIEFVYSRLNLVPYFFALWVILNLVSIPQTRALKQRMREQFEKELDRERDATRGALARQVKHNLRTPLAAMMRIPARLPNSVKSDRDLLSSTIQQIHNLLSTLDDKPDAPLSQNGDIAIYDTLTAARQELTATCPKRIDFKFAIDDQIVSALVSHIPFELRAVLSNLFNNSVEAIRGHGRIHIRVKDAGDKIIISIEDSGIGIPENIYDKIFDQGFSTKEKSGEGIGLFHAKNWIEKWKGKIFVAETSAQGSIFKIELPIEEREPWFAPRLRLNEKSRIIVLDDQLAGREMWKLKLQEEGFAGDIQVYASYHELKNANLAIDEDSVLLFDYDLGDSATNGLQILSSYDGVKERYLVTGHFDQREIRSGCKSIGVHLLPKTAVAEIPVILV